MHLCEFLNTLYFQYCLISTFYYSLGMVLAQLIIKAISILENSGAKIDGIVSDGASTNRKLWVKLGISGSIDCVKNYIIHPLDDSRKIFMFSDAPHLIKNVRNRLLNKKSLKVSYI